MTDKQTLLDLAAECERVKCGSRELDFKIEQALIGKDFYDKCSHDKKRNRYTHPEFGLIALPQDYTTSLDAAYGIETEGWEWEMQYNMMSDELIYQFEMGQHIRVEHLDHCLAVCAAKLRARAEDME